MISTRRCAVLGYATLGLILTPLAFCVPALAEPAGKAPTAAMMDKCSSEADAKGLFLRSGKGAERKAFRRQCVRKLMGLTP